MGKDHLEIIYRQFVYFCELYKTNILGLNTQCSYMSNPRAFNSVTWAAESSSGGMHENPPFLPWDFRSLNLLWWKKSPRCGSD